MEPIKFEENIKTKLEKRELEPSQDAWNSLANRLDAHEAKKPSKIVWWFGIAASIVGVLLVTNLFFTKTIIEASAPVLVESPNNTEQLININETTEPNTQYNETKLVEAPLQNIEKEDTPKRSRQQIIINKESVTETKVVQTNTSGNIPTNEELKSNSLLEKQGPYDAVAQIQEINPVEQVVTDSEIESLLKRAQQELTAKSLKNENTKTVDANSLLQDVESDLDQSFRDKVFETLKTSYKKVKTAVAERND